MKDLTPYLAILFFVSLTNALFVYYRCYARSLGYMWMAAFHIWPFLVVVFSLQTLLGVCIYEFFLPRMYTTQFLFQKTASAGFSGFLATAFPTGLIEWAVISYSARKDIKIAEALSHPVNRLILRTWVLNRFKAEIQELKSRDNFKAQFQLGWWDLQLSTDRRDAEREAGRRIRRLYEAFKLEIANTERKPHLLDIAGGYYPGNKFFLLVAFLGRKKLRELLAAPPPPPRPGCDWNGSERRKETGKKADRRDPVRNAAYSRIGDDHLLRERVERGELVELP